jgi:DNA-binding response OmpR family regulator
MRLLLIGSNKKFLNKYLPEFRKYCVVDVACEASRALHLSEFCCYDSIVLDSSSCDIPALELCGMIRDLDINYPILYLFENGDRPDRVRALNTGVDVMVRKPITVEELMAQVRVLIRRNANNVNCSGILISNILCLDLNKNKFFIKGRQVPLRRKEFDLLQYLMINRGRIISKEEILEHVWDRGIEIFSNTVEVHILNIRIKFRKMCGENIIKTHRGFGYEIESCENTPKALLSNK